MAFTDNYLLLRDPVYPGKNQSFFFFYVNTFDLYICIVCLQNLVTFDCLHRTDKLFPIIDTSLIILVTLKSLIKMYKKNHTSTSTFESMENKIKAIINFFFFAELYLVFMFEKVNDGKESTTDDPQSSDINREKKWEQFLLCKNSVLHKRTKVKIKFFFLFTNTIMLISYFYFNFDLNIVI